MKTEILRQKGPLGFPIEKEFKNNRLSYMFVRKVTASLPARDPITSEATSSTGWYVASISGKVPSPV